MAQKLFSLLFLVFRFVALDCEASALSAASKKTPHYLFNPSPPPLELFESIHLESYGTVVGKGAVKETPAEDICSKFEPEPVRPEDGSRKIPNGPALIEKHCRVHPGDTLYAHGPGWVKKVTVNTLTLSFGDPPDVSAGCPRRFSLEAKLTPTVGKAFLLTKPPANSNGDLGPQEMKTPLKEVLKTPSMEKVLFLTTLPHKANSNSYLGPDKLKVPLKKLPRKLRESNNYPLNLPAGWRTKPGSDRLNAFKMPDKNVFVVSHQVRSAEEGSEMHEAVFLLIDRVTFNRAEGTRLVDEDEVFPSFFKGALDFDEDEDLDLVLDDSSSRMILENLGKGLGYWQHSIPRTECED